MKQIYSMVGMKHLGTERLVADMKRDTILTLVRAPENPHDPNAVEIYYEGEHIAFVKATEASELAVMMDRGGHEIMTGLFTIGGDRWPQVEVDLR